MPFELTPITPDGSYVGRYTDSDTIRLRRGTTAANTDSNGAGGNTADEAAYAFEVDSAEGDLDALAALVGIAVPIVTTSGSAAAAIVKSDATDLAIWNLYWKRPAEGSTKNLFDKRRDAVLARWERWATDPATLPPGFTMATGRFDPTKVAGPLLVYPTVDADGRPVTPSNERVGAYYDPNARRYRPGRWGW